MYLGDHRWLVRPPNQYLVTDGVTDGRLSVRTLFTPLAVCCQPARKNASAACHAEPSLPQTDQSCRTSRRIPNPLTPQHEHLHGNTHRRGMSGDPWQDRQEGGREPSRCRHGDLETGILQRAAVAIETQNACHPMLSRIEKEEDSARNADRWLVNQLVYWLKIHLIM